jgi:hypothetical protein
MVLLPCPKHGPTIVIRSRMKGSFNLDHIGCLEDDCDALDGPYCRHCRGKGIIVSTKLRDARPGEAQFPEQRFSDCLICGQVNWWFEDELPTPVQKAKTKELLKKVAAWYRKCPEHKKQLIVKSRGATGAHWGNDAIPLEDLTPIKWVRYGCPDCDYHEDVKE